MQHSAAFHSRNGTRDIPLVKFLNFKVIIIVNYSLGCDYGRLLSTLGYFFIHWIIVWNEKKRKEKAENDEQNRESCNIILNITECFLSQVQ